AQDARLILGPGAKQISLDAMSALLHLAAFLDLLEDALVCVIPLIQMDLNDANLTKSLECPGCLDFFDEPKLLTCGHTVCQKCANKFATSRSGIFGRN
ncbi:tripartite motif containing 13-like protein, partial [Aphelenchoides avenae]